MLAAALVFQWPVHLKRKEVGGFALQVPMRFKDGTVGSLTHLQPRLEMDATVARKGAQLGVDLSELTALLRLWQD